MKDEAVRQNPSSRRSQRLSLAFMDQSLVTFENSLISSNDEAGRHDVTVGEK
jgi:hypothetical protein